MLTKLSGFDLSIMGEKLYDEAIVDVVGPDSLVSAPVSIKVCLLLYFL